MGFLGLRAVASMPVGIGSVRLFSASKEAVMCKRLFSDCRGLFSRWGVAGLLALVVFIPVPVRAQSALGTILGRVTDPSGGVVPNAQVTLRNVATNVSSATRTNGAGDYFFGNLIPGSYEVKISAKGFKSYVITAVVLSVDQTVRENAVLTVGSVATSVQVTAKLPVVQTDTSSVGSVIDSSQIQSMPLDDRTNIFGLLALAPGVQDAGTTARIAGDAWRGGVSETTDGASNLQLENEVLGAGFPSLDSIGEFKVIDSTGSAKYGTGSVAIVISTKSGTNQYHGSAFEYNRIAKLEAANFFATGLPKGPFVRNQFGGSLGGPIKRNKLFFFGSFEGLTFRTSTTRLGAMPTPALLNGNFSGLPPVIDPSTGLPFPGNQIPANRISSVSKALFPYFDTPNLPSTKPGGLGTNWIANVGTHQDNYRYEGRGDYDINQNNTLSVRYWNVRQLPNYFGGGTDKFGGVGEPEIDQNLAVNYTRILSPNLMNLASFGWDHIWDQRQPQNYTIQPGSVIPGIPAGLAGLGGLPAVGITGFTGLNDNPGSEDIQQTYQFSDDLTWVKGKHTFEGGFSFMHWQFFNEQNLSHGGFSFTGRYTKNPFADFLLGDLSSSSFPVAPLQATPANDRIGMYFQDSWKATPRLTLNMGLRDDLPTLYQNITGNMANWYPNLNQIVVLKGQYNASLFPTLPIVNGSSVGLNPGNYIGTDYNQLAPRLGFAYRPLSTTRLILRGGYGMYYNMEPWPFGSFETAVNPPFTGTENFEPAPGANPTLTFANPFPTGAGSVPSGVTISAYPKNYKYPLSHEWNLTVESQLSNTMSVRATYLGIETEHASQIFDINQPAPAPGPVQPLRPYQPFGPINLYETGQTANTQELQLSALRRFSSGLSFEAEYAWTKSLDSGGTDVTVPTDNRNIRLDRGNDPFIRQQYLVANYVYDLPFGRGERFLSSMKGPLNAILGGWETSGILTLASGLPYSVVFTSSIQGWPSNRANIVGNPAVSNPSLSEWFNPAAFAVPQPFTYGDSAPYSLFGPSFSDWNTAIFKQFSLTERYRLQFRAEFFNALNHPNFGNPNSNISVPSRVGTITSAGSPRDIQLGLRLSF
jgi:hypothetical protein